MTRKFLGSLFFISCFSIVAQFLQGCCLNTPERHSEFVDFQMAAKRILNIKSGNTFEFELSETVDGTMRYDSAVLFITHDVNTYYVKNSGIKGGGYLFACSESTVNDNLIDEIILNL